MQSIDVAHAPPRSPFGEFATRGPNSSPAVSDAENHRQATHCPDECAPSRGSDFVRQVLYAQVMTSLHADYRIGSAVPVQGLTPAESAAQGLAGATSQALAPGGKGAGSLRASVDSGLQEAAAQLQTLSFNVGDVAALAEGIRSQLESFIGAAGSAQAGGAPQESVAGAGVCFMQKQKTQLEIVTQEGDTVRLSLRSKVMVAAGGVASSAADGTASSAAVTVIAGSKFEISVDGNLNDEETAAIRDVLTKVEALAEDFFRGDVQAAFAAAAELHIDGDQLASVALDLTVKQRLQAVGFILQPAGSSPPAVPAAGTAPQAAQTPQVPANDTSPSEPLAQAAPAGPAGDNGAVADPTPANPPQSESTAMPGSTITDYLMHLLDSLRNAGNVGYASVSWKSKLELLLAVTSAHADAEPVPAAKSAVDKLGEAVTSLA